MKFCTVLLPSLVGSAAAFSSPAAVGARGQTAVDMYVSDFGTQYPASRNEWQQMQQMSVAQPIAETEEEEMKLDDELIAEIVVRVARQYMEEKEEKHIRAVVIEKAEEYLAEKQAQYRASPRPQQKPRVTTIPANVLFSEETRLEAVAREVAEQHLAKKKQSELLFFTH